MCVWGGGGVSARVTKNLNEKKNCYFLWRGECVCVFGGVGDSKSGFFCCFFCFLGGGGVGVSIFFWGGGEEELVTMIY